MLSIIMLSVIGMCVHGVLCSHRLACSIRMVKVATFIPLTQTRAHIYAQYSRSWLYALLGSALL